MDYYDEVVEIKNKPKPVHSLDTESVTKTSMEIEDVPKKEVISPISNLILSTRFLVSTKRIDFCLCWP